MNISQFLERLRTLLGMLTARELQCVEREKISKDFYDNKVIVIVIDPLCLQM